MPSKLGKSLEITSACFQAFLGSETRRETCRRMTAVGKIPIRRHCSPSVLGSDMQLGGGGLCLSRSMRNKKPSYPDFRTKTEMYGGNVCCQQSFLVSFARCESVRFSSGWIGFQQNPQGR